MPDLPARTGARLLVDALRAHGTDTVFTLPGDHLVDVLDALLDTPDVRTVTGRQEVGLSFMAEAHGRLTGRPGVALVNGGPSAASVMIGVQTARQDATPMLLLIGEGAAGVYGTPDPCRLFEPVAKWTARIDEAAQLPEIVAQAFHTAISGQPGPVVLVLPQTMLAAEAAIPDTPPFPPEDTPFPDLDALRTLLAEAERPLLLVGGSTWTDAACADLKSFAEAHGLPVACAFRRQDILDNESPSHAGDLGTWPSPALVQRVADADLLLVLGARLDEIGDAAPTGTVVHAHPCAEELDRIPGAALTIRTAMAPLAAALAAMPATLPTTESPRWAEWTEAARADFMAWLEPGPCVGDLDLGWVFGWLRDRLPLDAAVAVDTGSFSNWAQRHLLYRRPGRQLGPANGALGYALPAAIAAKLANPKKVAVGMAGDGGFLATSAELATAVQAGAAVILIVVNNGMFGTARLHQEWRFPGRVGATALANPDLKALAESFGAFGVTVERTEDFVQAFWDAMWSRKPAVIELRVDPEQITAGFTISQLRAVALAARKGE
ncbi:thiamine pyrophosphate-dependent enzyme [Azospirillum soli]|uniref:thiamine pyrophosphate-dependent enzyme n=1 Tax=Azospirillum soli TaxID=1304799 RepID=UPI001FE7D13C|nr:thiamine pyrophosphate-dependent enzyme [Azospirillum soli]MBP2315093.1 acetolactate synthase-1/2/3 large subunit [Azospirillum soli]